MKRFKLEISNGYSINLGFKDEKFHYENGSVRMKPMHYKNANVKKIKEEVIKTDMHKFLKFIDRVKKKIDADVEEIPSREEEKEEMLEEMMKEKEEEGEKEERRKRRRKKQSRSDKYFWMAMEKGQEVLLKGKEGKEEMEIIPKEEEGIVEDITTFPTSEREGRVIKKGKIEEYMENFFLRLPPEIFDMILKFSKEIEFVKKQMTTIKSLFFASKQIQEYYWDLFRRYLSFNMAWQNLNPRLKPLYSHGKILKASFSEDALEIDLSNTDTTNIIIGDNLPRNLKKLILNEIRFPILYLPKSLEYLEISFFNQKLILPNGSLKTLIFYSHFNQEIDFYPSSLEYLDLGRSYNKSLDKLENTKLKVLKLGDEFNQTVDKLPKYLIELEFGRDFSRNVNNLPGSLQKLSFGKYFNNQVDNLPGSLKELYFDKYFNQDVSNLPTSLTRIIFGSRFNQITLSFTRLKNLKYLVFNKDYDQKLDNLPYNLEQLDIHGNFNQTINNLPTNLKVLSIEGVDFNHSIDFLPSKLEFLSITVDDFNKSIDNLPISLKEIKLKGAEFNQPVDKLNTLKNLTHLEFGIEFNQPIEGRLPDSLEILELGMKFDKEVKNLPKNLEILILGDTFNKSIDLLPDDLTVLTLGHKFNKPINKLPLLLKTLKFGENFNQSIDNFKHHKFLNVVKFGYNFKQPIDNLPDSVESIVLSYKYKTPISKLPENLKYIEISAQNPSLRYISTIYIPKGLRVIPLRY
jgi:hypothetical protein